MYILYRDLFQIDSLDTSSNMWWDSLAYGYFCGNKNRVHSDEEKNMQDVMFETLCQILKLDSEACQGAALHGLGHLVHPDTEKVIRAWIAEHPDLPEEDVDYAEDCIAGRIM